MIPIIFPHPNGSGTALRGPPLIGFACLATLLNAWEQLYFYESMNTKAALTVIDVNYQQNDYFQLKDFLYIMRVPKLAGGPGRENQSTGSGGAPKFYKNWLAFACSPYDPDHISAPERVGDGPPRDSTHWLCFPRYSFKRMGTIIFLNKDREFNTTKKTNKK